MEALNKVKEFEKELDFIVNPKIRYFAEEAIKILPDYFFEIPSSSSNKYHPPYANGVGGLVRHSKAAVRIAVELFRTDLWKFTEDEKDLIISGLIVHDGFKSGRIQEKFSRADHPNIIATEISKNDILKSLVSDTQINFVVGNIGRHMGKWVEDYKTKEKILEKPETVSQRFTHLCDYIASRKCLDFNFDAEIERE